MSTGETLDQFSPSSAVIPESDPRDAAIKSIDAKCRECIELAHKLQASDSNLFELERSKAPISEIISAAKSHGMMEERLSRLVDDIHDMQRSALANLGVSLFISHTESGLPIRVRSNCKKRLWC